MVLLLVCLLFPRRLLVLCPCTLQDTVSLFRCSCCQPTHCSGALPDTEGARAVAFRVSGMLCAQVRCWASPSRLLASLLEVRLGCSSRLGAVAGPWLPVPLGEETLLGGLALPHPPQKLG